MTHKLVTHAYICIVPIAFVNELIADLAYFYEVCPIESRLGMGNIVIRSLKCVVTTHLLHNICLSKCFIEMVHVKNVTN